MAEILHELEIESNPDQVYKAITTADGLASWWTHRTKARPEKGSVSEFGFNGGAMVFKFKVDDLKAAEKVVWSYVDGGPPDWQGTTVTFDLSPAEKGTKLLFGHRNYQTTQGSYASVSYNWASFLTSLKQYIENGQGTPYSG